MTTDADGASEGLPEIRDAAALIALSNDPDRAALVLFQIGWHEPGRRLEGRLRRLAGETRAVNLARVDIGRLPEIAKMFGVTGAPALVLFRSGQVAARRLGDVEDADLIDWLDSELAV
jgi:thioredoxin-like negative regulator of GroEL